MYLVLCLCLSFSICFFTSLFLFVHVSSVWFCHYFILSFLNGSVLSICFFMSSSLVRSSFLSVFKIYSFLAGCLLYAVLVFMYSLFCSCVSFLFFHMVPFCVNETLLVVLCFFMSVLLSFFPCFLSLTASLSNYFIISCLLCIHAVR